MAFRMTSSAAREVLQAAERSGAEGMALRIAARPTEQGVSFGMGFDEEAPGDEVADFDGLTVLIAPDSRALLADALLDYIEIESGRFDFVFMNADQAGAECAAQVRGCGSGGCSRCG
jgi:iron-sulfur cluster assembly protein